MVKNANIYIFFYLWYDIDVMRMIVKIDKLAHNFKGIARVNDKVVFVENVLPMEIVDVRIVKDKKHYSDGVSTNIIEKNSDRVDSICPYFKECGGCSTGYIKYDKALIYKKSIVKDIIKKYAGYDVDPEIISNYQKYKYRNKVTLRVLNGNLAYTKEGSNELININKCYLVNDNINNIISTLNNIDLTGLSEVIIRGTDDIMVILYGDIDSSIIINELKDKVNSIVLNDKVIYGNEYTTIKVGKYKYGIYPRSFFQVNTDMISKLYDKVLEYAGTSKTLIDLYCGAGTIGIYLAKNFDTVKGIEINKAAIDSANLNKKINNINNISFECKGANEISNISSDVVVVDPPRSGLDKKTINTLLDSSSKKIVYVSCDPITLARDLNILKERYELKDITLFDMFPNTRHIETVCNLDRKN